VFLLPEVFVLDITSSTKQPCQGGTHDILLRPLLLFFDGFSCAANNYPGETLRHLPYTCKVTKHTSCPKNVPLMLHFHFLDQTSALASGCSWPSPSPFRDFLTFFFLWELPPATDHRALALNRSRWVGCIAEVTSKFAGCGRRR
jgi:hypothetical protein